MPPMPQRLRDAAAGLGGKRVTLQGLADAHGPSTHETLLVLLGALCILPVPGVGTVVGLGIVALSVVMWRGDPGVALPIRMARADVSREMGQRVLRLLARFHAVAARASRPRLQCLVFGSGGRTTAALAGLMGVLIALPIPFGNFFPSLALICIGLGLLREDGVALLLGAGSALLGVLWPAALAWALWHFGADWLVQTIRV